MIKKTLTLLFAAALLASCGNTGKKEAAVKAGEQSGAVKVEFASLVENPGNYIGKEISVEGKVVHVCMQSGKKLFISGENPDILLYVQAGEDMPKFPTELLGSEIVVEGTLTQAEASAMAEGEGMHAAGGSADMAEGDTCVTEKALAAQPALAELMMVYNKHTLVK
jgi:hypothetical protein